MELKLSKPYPTVEKLQGLYSWAMTRRKVLETTFDDFTLLYSAVNKASSNNVFNCDVKASFPLVGLTGKINMVSGPSRVGVIAEAEVGDTRKGLIFFGVSCVLFPLLPVYYYMKKKQVSQVEDDFNSLDKQFEDLLTVMTNPVVPDDD